MKKSIISLFFIALLVFVLLPHFGWCKTATISSEIPESTDIMFKVSSLKSVFDHFSITENSIFGEPIASDDIDSMRSELGFNLLSINDLQAVGVNIQQHIGIAIDELKLMENDDPQFHLLIFIPVTEKHTLTEKLISFFTREFQSIQFDKQGEYTAFTSPTDDLNGYILERNRYVFIGLKPMQPESSPTRFLTSMAQKTPLSQSSIYRNVISKIPENEDLFVYVNIFKIISSNYELLKRMYLSEDSEMPAAPGAKQTLNYLKECKGAGIFMDMDRTDLIVRSAIDIQSDSNYLSSLKGLGYDKQIILGIKENPLLLSSFAINVAEYYKTFLTSLSKDEFSQYKEKLQTIKTQNGIDVEADIISNLGGNFNVGVYDGSSINMTNFNILFTLNLKNEDRMKRVLDQWIARLPTEQKTLFTRTEIRAAKAYVLNFLGIYQCYITVHAGNLIVTIGKPMLEKALQADLKSGFIRSMADKSLAASLSGNTNLFYLNVDEAIKAMKNFAVLFQQYTGKSFDETTEKQLNNLEYLLATSKLEADSLFSDLIVKSRFNEPFFKGILKMMNELSKSANPPGKK